MDSLQYDLWQLGVAVGCGWQTFVAYVNIGCYYVVGVPLGVLLAFKFDFGAKVNILLFYVSIFISFLTYPNHQVILTFIIWLYLIFSDVTQGIWSGLIGGMTMQTLILLWVTFRTDWNKEVIFKDSNLGDKFNFFFFIYSNKKAINVTFRIFMCISHDNITLLKPTI